MRQQLIRGRFAGDAVIAGRYEIRSLIGQGARAEVYAAYDRALGRAVALKILKEGLAVDRKAMARFRREARAVAALSHAGIVNIHDVVVEGSVPFMVMELLQGEPLSEVIRRDAPMPVARTAAIGEAVARALAFAHDAGIVHRDVKPGNVMVGPGDHPKVLDFGIARAIAWTPLTDDRPIQATAGYASPEQFQGFPLDARSDVYSLGVVLYEMLCGLPPFRGTTIATLAYQHVQQPPPPLRTFRPGIAPALERAVARCMAKAREGRYQSAGELADDLRRFHVGGWAARAARADHPAIRSGTRELSPDDQPIEAGNVARPHRARVRWSRVLAGVLVVVGLMAATAAAGLYLLARTGQPARAKVAAAPSPTPPPPLFAPTALLAESGCDGFLKAQIRLTWLPTTSTFADGYVLYRADAPRGPFDRIQLLPGRDTTTFVDHHLNTSSTYYYEVRATAGSRSSESRVAARAETPFICLS